LEYRQRKFFERNVNNVKKGLHLCLPVIRLTMNPVQIKLNKEENIHYNISFNSTNTQNAKY